MSMLVSNERQSKRAPQSVILSDSSLYVHTETPRIGDFIVTRLRCRHRPSYQEQHLEGKTTARFAALPLEHDLFSLADGKPRATTHSYC